MTKGEVVKNKELPLDSKTGYSQKKRDFLKNIKKKSRVTDHFIKEVKNKQNSLRNKEEMRTSH